MACSVEGCARPTYCRSMCKMHYARAWRTGDPGGAKPLRVYSYGDQECSVSGCEQTARADGMCMSHYQQRHRAQRRARHGTTGYRQGCRCAKCRKAHAADTTRWKRRQPRRQARVTMTLDDDLAAAVDQIAAERNITRAALVREAVAAYVERTAER